MRGPSGRAKYVVRRTWECPACRRRVVTPGKIAHLACTCAPAEGPPRWMQLVDEPRPRRFSLLPGPRDAVGPAGSEPGNPPVDSRPV